MSAPNWSDLLVNVNRFYPPHGKGGAKLSVEQVEQLECAANAGENFNVAILHGVAAVGELISHAATTKGLSDDCAHSLGWLVHSLASLSLTMTETADAAKYTLQAVPRERGVSK